MLNKIIRFALNNRPAVVIVAVLVLLGGLYLIYTAR